MSFLSFLYRHNTLEKSMLAFTGAIDAAAAARLNNLADEIEAYAKENAPWEDQTGAAREGLTTEVSHSATTHTITLFHTVDYGVWLEIRWSGTYAIIMPTIEHFAGEVFTNFEIAAGGGDDG